MLKGKIDTTADHHLHFIRLTDLVKHRTMISVAYQKGHFEGAESLGCQTTKTFNTISNRGLTSLSASSLSESVKKFIEEKARICKPDEIQICDGSETENQQLIDLMVKQGMLEKLPKYQNWYV
ncbi:hypothetical protein BLA29_012277 [Euroglyphus maynei]|uniref:Phosphoenolpyruvate carboxykinase GTP-utilising N-terminal domain-containing protein n=1 Tax=Euroglyphus maynei TaxID=6958 RepID=A0A1Y3B149_EURMA|nr:hypothetical protein BLA29_012277 [Euroglyphus maynei]